ncbi:MAG: hypothetical protein DRQ44_12190 [Gammaproteobacteria bacterium]|nr:MAG: hypothetical protein DRQ44_12190 [Gammaproteobacteria bacterium]
MFGIFQGRFFYEGSHAIYEVLVIDGVPFVAALHAPHRWSQRWVHRLVVANVAGRVEVFPLDCVIAECKNRRVT